MSLSTAERASINSDTREKLVIESGEWRMKVEAVLPRIN